MTTSTETLEEQLQRIRLEYDKLQQQQDTRENVSISKYFNNNRSLPRLIINGDSPGPSTNREHLPINDLKQREFGILDFGDLDHCRDRDVVVFTKHSLEASTEQDVQQFVRLVMEDMIIAAKHESHLSLRNDLAISELKADFWIISYNGFPAGAIEIKKPGKISEKVKKINFGQHGLANVLGLFTNWDEWTIAWLSDSDNSAVATDLNNDSNGSKEKSQSLF